MSASAVVVPARHPVTPGIIGRERGLSPHDGDQFRTIGPLEARAAFYLGDIAAADDPQRTIPRCFNGSVCIRGYW